MNRDNIIKLDKPPKRIDIVPVIAGQGGWAALGTFLLQVLIAAAISFALYLLIEPSDPEAPETEAATRGVDESFLFSNKANIAQQGTSVPLGYGRLRVGSHVIHFTSKNFAQNTKTTDLMKKNIHGAGFIQTSESTYI